MNTALWFVVGGIGLFIGSGITEQAGWSSVSFSMAVSGLVALFVASICALEV